MSQQFPTDVGPIDILARHKTDGAYVVIESKKGRSSGSVVGQILRYIAWVRKELANGKAVEELIMVPEVDRQLALSFSDQKKIGLMIDKIDFKLMGYQPPVS